MYFLGVYPHNGFRIANSYIFKSGKMKTKICKDTVRCGFLFWFEWSYFRLSSAVVLIKKIPPKLAKTVAVSDFQITITYHQMALENRKYHYSNQNLKIHRTVSLVFFFEKIDLPTFFFILPVWSYKLPVLSFYRWS